MPTLDGNLNKEFHTDDSQTAQECVLITGATGLIGYHVARELALDEGFRIICIVRSGSNSNKLNGLKSLGIDLEEGSFFDADLLARVFESYPIRYVVHLAALRGGGEGSREDYAQINIQGTETLLQMSLANNVQRFIFFSSVGVFGTIPKQLPAGLNTALNGDNLYHASKIESEKIVTQYSANGLDTMIIRPTITYGPEDNGFPTTLVKLVRNRKFVICGGGIRIHMLDVNRLAAFVHRVLRDKGLSEETLIIADRAPVSLKLLVDQIHSHFYGVPYPGYLQMPKLVFRVAACFFKAIGNEKWLARTLLISQNWYYDIEATLAAVPDFNPSCTENNFIPIMCAEK